MLNFSKDNGVGSDKGNGPKKRGASFFDELTRIYRERGGGALSSDEISELIQNMIDQRKKEQQQAKNSSCESRSSDSSSGSVADSSKSSSASATPSRTKTASRGSSSQGSKGTGTTAQQPSKQGCATPDKPIQDSEVASGQTYSSTEDVRLSEIEELSLGVNADGVDAVEVCEEQSESVWDFDSMELPLDWENAFANDVRAEGVVAETVSDGMILSLTTLGRVDIEYISQITGKDYKSVILALKGSIYQNPLTWEECFYKGWETAEEYLSGNILQKYRTAEEANEKYNGYFEDNITALKSVLPSTVKAKDIYVTLGSPWVPVSVIDEFICHIMKLPKTAYHGTKHDELTGTWDIYDKSSFAYRNSVASRSTYGTPRLEAIYILERTLNMKTVCVTDEVTVKKPGGYFGARPKEEKRRIINKEETLLALEKQRAMIDEFVRWVWSDRARKKLLVEIFESKFSSVKRRIFDGSFLTFPNMSDEVSLYPYQKNAIARILFSPNTLLAHDVGSGKTLVMATAGMELRRMGLSAKNLFVVPNNIVGQWRDLFLRLYPSATLMTVEPKHFTPQKRKKTLERLRDGEFDGIIMAYSCFERIPLSREYYLQTLQDEKEKIAKLSEDEKKCTSKLKRKGEAITHELAELAVKIEDADELIYFDELGITRLFVDEAHNFKNIPLDTKVDKVLGISAGGSKKCQDMLDKVRYIQRTNDGGGVVMATGTPITNSITDAFVMQTYLQSGELAMLDLQSFDSWIGMFAEKVTEFEIDVDTSGYRLATRFSRFHNLPELTTILASVADFHRVDKTAGIPDFDGYHQTVVPRTKALADYLDDISKRADKVRAGKISRVEDNMLKITTDGRKAALDMRLVKPKTLFTQHSKVHACAENVYNVYVNTMQNSSAQLVFCDTSTPKQDFNIYDELVRLLVARGIPREKIAFVHDAESERQRTALFDKVRRGVIRVLIGSTFKLGLGVNVQDKLVAIHHIDAPWRPADLTQRDGRILRQGNENDKVFIFRYVTEGSFDSYVWQLLETKARFIEALLSGSVQTRSASDIESTVLDYAEVKALAIGNPRIKERVEVANELNRALALQRKAIETHVELESELASIPWQIKKQREKIRKTKADAEHYAECKLEIDKEEKQRLREYIFDAVRDNVLMQEERVLMEYQGFSIVLPLNMTEERPFVWLMGKGKYYVELGTSAVGVLVRIDNFLDGLNDYAEKLNGELKILMARERNLRIELSKKEDFTDRIAELKVALEKLDKELGVCV